jgi:hypothetical protein
MALVTWHLPALDVRCGIRAGSQWVGLMQRPAFGLVTPGCGVRPFVGRGSFLAARSFLVSSARPGEKMTLISISEGGPADGSSIPALADGLHYKRHMGTEALSAGREHMATALGKFRPTTPEQSWYMMQYIAFGSRLLS